MIALLGAVSTTMAVVVALMTTRATKQAGQPRLKAFISKAKLDVPPSGLMVTSSIDGPARPLVPPIYVTLRLTNVGKVPVYLDSDLFAWQVPFSKPSYWMVTPLEARGGGMWMITRDYPCTIHPGSSELIFLATLEEFKDDLAKAMETGRFGRRLSVSFLRGVITTQDGSQFRVSLSRTLRQELLGDGRYG